MDKKYRLEFVSETDRPDDIPPQEWVHGWFIVGLPDGDADDTLIRAFCTDTDSVRWWAAKEIERHGDHLVRGWREVDDAEHVPVLATRRHHVVLHLGADGNRTIEHDRNHLWEVMDDLRRAETGDGQIVTVVDSDDSRGESKTRYVPARSVLYAEHVVTVVEPSDSDG